MFISDSIFLPGTHFGNSEIPCQDFALDGESITEKGFVIISDGCSGAEHTDLGARLLSFSAVAKLRRDESIRNFPFLGKCSSILNQLELMPDYTENISSQEIGSLFATLLSAQETEENIEINCSGDGFIFLQSEDIFDMIHVEYTPNAPYYLAYDFHSSLKKDYVLSFPNIQKTVTELKFKILDSEKLFLSESDTYNHIEILSSKIQNTPYNENLFFQFPKEKIKSVLLSSDGLDSFHSKDGKEISWERVFSQILPVMKKPSYGALKRRILKFKERYEKQGWIPGDDLSFGVLMRKI